MRLLHFLLRQSLLVRLTVLLLLPAAGIAWLAQGFALGEWCLAGFLLGLLLFAEFWSLRPAKQRKTHVDPVHDHSG